MEISPVVSDKKIFKVFYIVINIGKISPDPGGHVFWQIQMASTILVQDHQRNIFAKLYWNRSSGFGQEDFLIKKSIFSFCDLDMKWTGTIWTTLKEDQPRIIPVKFGQIPTSGLGGDVV